MDSNSNNEPQRSIRQVCFELFDRGKKPAEVAKEMGFSLPTVRKYYSQWKEAGGSVEIEPDPIEEEPWDSSVMIVQVLEEISRRLGISFDCLADRYFKYQEDIKSIAKMTPRNRRQEAQVTAAEILNRIQFIMVGAAVFNLPPAAALRDLRRQGIDFRRFRF